MIGRETETVATHSGTLVVGDIELPCFILGDGRRVISGRGVTAAIGMKGRGSGIGRILNHPSLQSHLSEELSDALEKPIFFSGVGTRATAGYEAVVLSDLCAAILDAREAGDLRTPQELRYAHFAERLIRSFARVGLIALIDEATGFQDERRRSVLKEYLAAELPEYQLAWALRLPDEYYRQLFRLSGLDWVDEDSVLPTVGRITDKLIFKQMTAGVNESLRSTIPNPPGSGRRKWKHHQFLSEDIGQQDLRDHVLQIVTLMRVSDNWAEFEGNFRRLFPDPEGHGLLADLDRMTELPDQRSEANEDYEPEE